MAGWSSGEQAEIVAAGRPGAYVVLVGGREQSFVDLQDPTRLDFDYVRRMGDAVDAHGSAGRPLSVVHVGGAGMGLARYVAATRPRSSQVVLEPDADLTDLVRERLPLPRRSGIRVRPVTGLDGVAALRARHFDVAVLDAFAAGRVPDDLVTPSWFAAVAAALAPDGLFLANLTDAAPFAHTRRVVAGLRAVFDHLGLSAEPATLRGRRAGNLLVLASRAPVPLGALRARAASSPSPYRVLDAGQVSSSFGGGAAF